MLRQSVRFSREVNIYFQELSLVEGQAAPSLHCYSDGHPRPKFRFCQIIFQQIQIWSSYFVEKQTIKVLHCNSRTISKIFSCQLRIRYNWSVGQVGQIDGLREVRIGFSMRAKNCQILSTHFCIPLPSILLITHSPLCCRWSRGQTLVSEGEVLSLGRSVRRSDAGEFTCRAVNRHGETETQARDTDPFIN